MGRQPRREENDLGKIVISENVSVDGVIQDPSGAEGFRLGGWVGRIGDRGRDETAKVVLEEALGVTGGHAEMFEFIEKQIRLFEGIRPQSA